MPRRKTRVLSRQPPKRDWRAVALDAMMHTLLRLRQKSHQERLDKICHLQQKTVGDLKAFVYHNQLYASSHYGDRLIPQNHTHVLDPSLHESMEALLESEKDFKHRTIYIRSMLMNALNISIEKIDVSAYLPSSFMQCLPQDLAKILTGEHKVTQDQVLQFEQTNEAGIQFLKEQMMMNILEG